MRKLLLGLLLLTTPAFAGDVAWVSSNHIQVIDLDKAEVVGRIPLQEFIHDMAFHPDGSVAYVASSKGLRVADAEKLQFEQKVDDRNTRGLEVSADGRRLVAIHRAPGEDALAARRAGLPLPPSTVAVYSTDGMTVESSFPVSGNAFDLALSPDGQTVYVLVPHDGAVEAYRTDGSKVETIRLVAQDATGPHQAMLSEMAMSPDGSRLVIPVTDADQSWLAEVDLAAQRPAAERVLRQDLGHARRIQGVRWDEDGSGVFVTAINAMVKYGTHGLPIAWKGYGVNFVDVHSAGGDRTVAVTPTLSKANGSGGVAVLDDRGEVLRSVELPDMSPFVVVVRP